MLHEMIQYSCIDVHDHIHRTQVTVVASQYSERLIATVINLYLRVQTRALLVCVRDVTLITVVSHT